MMGGYYGWSGVVWMGLAMLFFWGGLLVLGLFALRWIFRTSRGQQPAESAEDILKNRLAKGEISKEQFEELRGLVRR